MKVTTEFGRVPGQWGAGTRLVVTLEGPSEWVTPALEAMRAKLLEKSLHEDP